MLISYFKKYPYVFVMIVVALVWMLINIIQGKDVQQQLNTQGKYTLATIDKIEGAKSGRFVTIEFEYNQKKIITESKSESIPLSWIGEKIFIKFLPSSPMEFNFYDSVPVSDSIKELGNVIWDRLPEQK